MQSKKNEQDMLAFVQKLCRSEENGSRILSRHDMLVVMDLGVWRQCYTEIIHSRYPSSVITIQECPTSLSGFQVFISYGDKYPKLQNFFVVFLCFVVTVMFLIYSLHITFHDIYVTPNPWAHNATINNETCSSIDNKNC
jgi:hypothetical protein